MRVRRYIGNGTHAAIDDNGITITKVTHEDGIDSRELITLEPESWFALRAFADEIFEENPDADVYLRRW